MIQPRVRIGHAVGNFIFVILEQLFCAAKALMLAEDAKNRRVNDEVLQARWPVHREIDLFDKHDLMIVIPMVQNGVEGGGFHMLAHQEEFRLSDRVRFAIVGQFECTAEILERFRIFPKDEQKVCPMFNTIVDLFDPAFDVGVYNSQFPMSNEKHKAM